MILKKIRKILHSKFQHRNMFVRNDQHKLHQSIRKSLNNIFRHFKLDFVNTKRNLLTYNVYLSERPKARTKPMHWFSAPANPFPITIALLIVCIQFILEFQRINVRKRSRILGFLYVTGLGFRDFFLFYPVSSVMSSFSAFGGFELEYAQ